MKVVMKKNYILFACLSLVTFAWSMESSKSGESYSTSEESYSSEESSSDQKKHVQSQYPLKIIIGHYLSKYRGQILLTPIYHNPNEPLYDTEEIVEIEEPPFEGGGMGYWRNHDKPRIVIRRREKTK